MRSRINSACHPFRHMNELFLAIVGQSLGITAALVVFGAVWWAIRELCVDPAAAGVVEEENMR